MLDNKKIYEEVKNKIEKEFYKKHQEFGRGEFYQSFPKIGIKGQRPTDKRIEEYGILDILTKDMTVLDIGCNCGFLDMSVCDYAKKVTGVEYNKDLVKIANKTAKYLQLDNVNFVAVDYGKWVKKQKEIYDIIFSFAVHYWLKVTPELYARQLDSMLTGGGYIFFESQNLETVDKEFDEYIKCMISQGMTVEKDGEIKDDGVIRRRYLVLRKGWHNRKGA